LYLIQISDIIFPDNFQLINGQDFFQFFLKVLLSNCRFEFVGTYRKDYILTREFTDVAFISKADVNLK